MTEGPAFKDYYEVLHLHPEADAAMVDQAYWHLARLSNAAIPTDSTARLRLEELNEAYSVLRTPELRDEYDALRDAVLGEGAPPAQREAAGEPPPLSVMTKQKARPREVGPVEQEEARELPLPSFNWFSAVRQLQLPNWQSALGVAGILVLAAAAWLAGASPLLILVAVFLSVGFTIVPLLGRTKRLPKLPRPQVALPAIGPPNLADRLPRQGVNPERLRESTEAMVARWRENNGSDSTAPGQDTS